MDTWKRNYAAFVRLASVICASEILASVILAFVISASEILASVICGSIWWITPKIKNKVPS